MNKLTQEQIKEIRKRRKKGESSYKLAKEFNVAQSTICYHSDKNTKQKHTYESRKEYLKDYYKKKYRDDKDFREKHKERCRVKKEKKA